jgi:hypothetical protein
MPTAADARATGLGAPIRRSITHTMTKGKFAGRTFELMQLGIRDLVACQEECTEDYKRAHLQTYTRNVDLMPPDMREKMIGDAFLAASEIHYEGLPAKMLSFPVRDRKGVVTVDPETGRPVMEARKVEYVMWWLTETVKGKLHSAWLAMRKCQGQGSLTLADVDDVFVDSTGDLETTVEKVGELSMQRVLGNADAPEEAERPPARETARQRRIRQRKEKARANTLTGLG